MSAKNGTATAAVKEPAKEVMRMEVLQSTTPYPRFKLTIASYDGGTTLEIATDKEEELEGLLGVWEPILRPEFETPDGKKLFPGATCPECSGKLRTKKSASGNKFLGCNMFPGCRFTAQL